MPASTRSAAVLLSLVTVAPFAPAQTTSTSGGGLAFDNRQPSMALDMCVTTSGIFGTGVAIRMFAFPTPVEWERADGRLLSTATDNYLFKQIGSVYGGDGETSFALPDLRGRVPVGLGQGPGLSNYNVAWAFGQSSTALTPAHLPPHQHTIECGRLTEPAGEGLPHDTRQESIAMRWSIAQNGVFPFRPRPEAANPGDDRGIAGSPAAPYYSQVFLQAAQPTFSNYYAPCDGRIISSALNTALFSLLGTTFGGAINGTTFGYPDLRGRAPVGLGFGAPVGPYEWGEKAGAEFVSMSVFDMPLHSHAVPSAPDTYAAGFGSPMENRQPMLALRWCICVQGVYPSGPGVDDQYLYVGEVAAFACSFAPVGFLECDGRLVNIADFDTLYALLGTRYGGDGVNNFRLPDLRGRVVVGSAPSLPVGTVFGDDKIALDEANLPPHAHGLPPACPGDMNGDGVRDTADLPVFLGVFGQSLQAGTCGDFNADGIINTPDLAVFLGGFGLNCP